MKRLPADVMRCATIDPLYISIDWDNLLVTVPDELSMLADLPVLQQLAMHAELLDSLVDGETEVKDDAPKLWAQFETTPVHWRVVYKGQATNSVERAKAACCWALATQHLNMANQLPVDTFGKGKHVAALKKATQAVLAAGQICPSIDDPDHTTPIEQACGVAICTIFFELVFFSVRSLPPLEVTDDRLLDAAGMLRNIASLADTIIAASPVPQKPILMWAKTVHTWAINTVAFVWAHHLNKTIVDSMDCKKTAETLAEIHMLLEMYHKYGAKRLTGFVKDPLDEEVIGQFVHGYKNDISQSWEPVYSKQLQSNNLTFLPVTPTMVDKTLGKHPVEFLKLFSDNQTPPS